MKPVREIHRSGRPVRKTGLFLVLLLASVVLVTGCGGDEQTSEDTAEDQSNPSQTTEQAERATNAERAEDTGMDRDATARESTSQEVTLKIEGDPGTTFSGACNVGDQREEITGEAPQNFVYDLPEGQKLNCEVRKSGSDSGSLKVTLTAPGNNIVQQTNTPGGSLNLSFSGSGATSSSGGNSSSIIQQSFYSGSSSSSSS
ncbi:MAG: hypothetical protein AVDCRST_MAG37-3160 [uncultured Rubrobacteraceae bacterium]|uniref:Lipoprotein n=1 Tax=uncultured Rubrobacteraceae bacterium TaxID=349277 RepID=A0A6J4QWJ8_9ACTN|nr:MAG: hypothetical protein AVDCRST_MAG37-3160 [uncultured Rubrobacteraceae bacterium]